MQMREREKERDLFVVIVKDSGNDLETLHQVLKLLLTLGRFASTPYDRISHFLQPSITADPNLNLHAVQGSLKQNRHFNCFGL